jgi:hypothetical protein
MSLQLTTVTWYSQLLAIVLALGIFILGFYVGQTYSTISTSPQKPSELDVLPPIMDIPFVRPLLLSGVIETSDRVEENERIAVRLDAESMKAIPLIAQSTTDYKYLEFRSDDPQLLKVGSPLSDGTKVRFEIVGYRYDRRVIETYDSGTLVGFEKVAE